MNELEQFIKQHELTLEDLKWIMNELPQWRFRQLDTKKKHIQSYKDNLRSVLKSGDIKIDFEKNYVFKRNQRILIHDHELYLLGLLVSNPYETIRDEELMDILKKQGHDVGYRSMVVYISRVSQAVGRTPLNSRYIKRVRNKGYCWNYFVEKLEK